MFIIDGWTQSYFSYQSNIATKSNEFKVGNIIPNLPLNRSTLLIMYVLYSHHNFQYKKQSFFLLNRTLYNILQLAYTLLLD